MKKTRNKVILRMVVFGIPFLIVFFLIEAAEWFQAEWDDTIDFATIMYQLSTPLKGTGTGIIEDFCKVVLPKTFQQVFLVVFFYFGFAHVLSRVYMNFHVKIINKEIVIYVGKKELFAWRALFWVLSIFILGTDISGKITELGIDSYIKARMHKSSIFEECYIAPGDVQIIFPDKKRNLLFIYLESMETTFASVEDGGGKSINYIPELTELANAYVNVSDNDGVGGIMPSALTGWTMAALLGSTSGIPYKIPGDGNSSDRYSDFLPGLVTLGDMFRKQGYSNYFLCGSDAAFVGRDVYRN